MVTVLPLYVCLLAVLVPGAASWDISSLVHDATSAIYSLWYPPSAPRSSTIEVDWGVPDTKAVIGRVFKYPIPWRAFKGENLSYVVSKCLINCF